MLKQNGHDDDVNDDDNNYVRLVGHGGSLVDSTPFVRRVVGSNPALAATQGP